MLIVVLIAPFALLAFFAVRTLGVEYDALNARRAALFDQRLQATAALVSARLDLAGTEGLSQARAMLLTRGEEALRYFVLSNGVAFALVFADGRRIFPPDDSDVLLLRKQGGLRAFENTALSLRPALEQAHGGSVAALVPVGDGAYALLRCSRSARSADKLDVCVAVEAAEVTAVLNSALTLVARDVGTQHAWLVSPENRRFGFIDTSATRLTSAAPTVSRPLDGLLGGWRIEAQDLDGARSSLLQALAVFAIGGSLIAGWGALTWSLHRASVAEAAEAARRAKVIAQLSHELRTPLANLRLHVDLLQRKSGDGAAVARYASVVDAEIGRLEQLAENAIDVARGAMAGPQQVRDVPDDSLRAMVDRFAPLLARAGCAVRLHCAATSACWFDRPSWERIIVNLLDNACKYAPGTEIEIGTSLGGDVLRLAVRDHGAGVPVDQRSRAFEPLFRGEQPGVAGFGLGLSAVRSLAQQNGGDAWVEDAAPGARFCVTMWVRADAGPREQSA